MLRTLLAGFLELVMLHGPDGQRVFVNVAEITTIREPISGDLQQHFPRGAQCVVVMVNGKFVATREDCDEVRGLINWRASK